MITLKLTTEQAEQLAQIIDSATQGVKNASVTLPLYGLLMQAAQEAQKTIEPAEVVEAPEPLEAKE